MTKRSSVLAVALLAGVAVPAVAEARIVDLHLAGNAGGMYGWGTTSNTPDFFNQAAGPGFGFAAGLKLLVFAVDVDFLQIVKDGGLDGTLIQLMAGIDVDLPAGHAKLPSGQSLNIIRIGMQAGGALGTGAPVSLPITNDQLADKGFVSRLRVGYDFYLNDFMSVGAMLDLGYHYFLGGQAINNTADHSAGYHLVGLANFTFHLGA
ncbi:MAG TPA: hypothetical protein VIF57_27825 [Polyangia bacterium]|jgi:hypothetical protein